MTEWTRRDVLKVGLAASFGLSGGMARLIPPRSFPAPLVAGRERLLLDFGWRFHLGHADEPVRGRRQLSSRARPRGGGAGAEAGESADGGEGGTARRVGAAGKVYAVDLDRSTLDRIVERGKGTGLGNIVPVLARTDDPRLPPGSLDLVFVCNVYADLGNRPHYLGLLRKVLRKGGRLAVIAYRAEETPVGPPLHARLTRETIIDELQRAGFRFEAEYHFLPYQYFVVFVVP